MFKSFSQSRERFSLGLCLGIDCRYLLASGGGDWVARITALPGRSRLAPRVSGRWIS